MDTEVAFSASFLRFSVAAFFHRTSLSTMVQRGLYPAFNKEVNHEGAPSAGLYEKGFGKRTCIHFDRSLSWVCWVLSGFRVALKVA